MTDKERIFRYLNGQLSKSSFRKWLMTADNLEDLFHSDAKNLRDLADKFSLTGKIFEILNKYIDKDEFKKFQLKVYLDKNCKSVQDPVELIRHLSSIAYLLPDKPLVHKISYLNEQTIIMPTLKEEKLWNSKAFTEKRSALPHLIPYIKETFDAVTTIASTSET